MSGTASLSGHLLCALPWKEPKQVTDRIREKHPHLKITYHEYTLGDDWSKYGALSEEIWKDVTLLCTYNNSPPSLAAAPALKYVHLFSAGSDQVQNLPMFTQTTIPFTTSTGVSAPVIAEWVVMMILVASHKYNVIRDRQVQHIWEHNGAARSGFTSSRALGKRIGILGYGAIGRQVARLCNAMGMSVIAGTDRLKETKEARRYDGYVVPGTGDSEGVIPVEWHSGGDLESLHRFLESDLDYLLISLPLMETTRRLLGKEEFEILARKNAFVINVARGGIIDQDALVEALHAYEDESGVSLQGRKGLSGAALDVAEPEPLPKDSPLWSAPNCLISPHISARRTDHSAGPFEVLELNLDRLARGERLLNQINRKGGRM